MAHHQTRAARWKVAAWPLRLKLTIVMLLLALTPMSLLAALNAYQADQQVRRDLDTEAEALVEVSAGQLSESIDRLHNISYLMAAAQATRLVGASIVERETYLNSILNTTNAINRLVLVEPDGTVILATPRIGNVRQLAVPDAARSGRFSTGVTTDENGKAQYTIYSPVVTQNATRMVLVITADFAALLGRSATSSVLPRAKDGAFMGLTDETGRIVFTSLPGAESDRLKEINLAQDQTVAAAMKGELASEWTSSGLGDVHLSAGPVGGTTWVVFYGIPGAVARAELEAPQAFALRNIVVLLTLAFVGVVIFGMLVGGQLVKPILHVGGVMSRVRQGDLGARVSLASQDEMGRLGQDINQTLDSVVALVQTRDERDNLQRSIFRLLDEVSEVASGNLTIQAQVTADQIGAIADAFNYMIEELRGLVHRTQATADEVTNESQSVTSMTSRLVDSADQQAQRLAEARASVSLMTELMGAVRATVGDSVNAVGEARSAVEAGQQVVGETTGAMSRLRNETRETAKKIKRLGESSQEIGEIVRLINEIADQTHLLALNASIQAAMAGEHGRGFAVVAEEVRALAERSANATEKIDELIRLIQTDTNAAMVAMERSTQEVVAGSRLADKAGETLATIGVVTERVVELSGSIENLVQRQVTAADHLQSTVGEVATSTASSLEDVRAMAVGMRTLEALSASLRESVSVFRVDVEADATPAPETELTITSEAA